MSRNSIRTSGFIISFVTTKWTAYGIRISKRADICTRHNVMMPAFRFPRGELVAIIHSWCKLEPTTVDNDAFFSTWFAQTQIQMFP